MVMILAVEMLSEPSLTMSRRIRWVMVQKSSMMVPALSRAFMELTAMATLVTSPPIRFMANLAASMKMGLPGGCPTSSLKPCEMNSGQSQKDAVGSIVSR